MRSPSKYRKRTSPVPNLILGISLTVWALLTLVGYRSFSADQAESGLWGCEMAYMYPSFTPIPGVDDSGSRYSLFLYREGGKDSPLPSGYPVIFIPGNAGSYKQARSIGGSAATQFYAQEGKAGKWSKNIDLFTVDFNEDFSALHAPTLRSQAQFLGKAITRVLESYDHMPEGERPSSVTLLGHSMGGIVARLAVTSATNPPVDAIVTMSTPHLQAPAPLDYEMERIYSEINGARYQDPAPLLVSISGGVSDIQIVSDSCALSNSLVGPDDGFAVFSSGVPGVWTGVEHQAMVWCDQMRYRVARTLLDMGASTTRRGRLAAAHKWLLGKSGHRLLDPTIDSFTRIDLKSPSLSVLVKLAHTTEESLVRPPLEAQFCRAEGECVGKAFSIHVVPWLPVSERPFPLLGEGSRPDDSVFVLDFDDFDSRFGWVQLRHPRGATVQEVGAFTTQTVPTSRWDSDTLTAAPVHLALHFTRPVVSSVVAYRMTLETKKCSGHMPTVQYTSQPSSPLYSPSLETRYYPLRSGSVTLHSHISGSPYLGDTQHTPGISLDVYQQPSCPVTSITLSVDPIATLAKVMLRLRIAVLAWCVGWVVTILFFQLHQYSSNGSLPSFSDVIEEQGPKFAIGTVGVATGTLVVQHVGSVLNFPTGHLFLGLSRVSFLPLTVLMAAWSWGTVVLVHTMLQGSVRLLERLLRSGEKGASRLDSKGSSLAIGSRVVLGLVLLGLIVIVIPYRLAFAILYIVQFSLTAYAASGGPSPRLHLLDTLLLLMAFLLPFNLPALAVWGKSFWIHGQHAYPEDRAILPVLPALGLVLVSSLERPLAAPKRVRPVAKWGTALVAVLAFTFAPLRPYILMPTVNVVFIVASVLMVFSSAAAGGEE